MTDDKPAPFTLPAESFIDKAGTWMGATIIAFTGVVLFGMLTVFGLKTIGDYAFLAFFVALLSTIVRHMIRIDRSEESDNYEEISLHDRWHLTVPRPPGQATWQLPPRPEGRNPKGGADLPR